MSLFTPYFNETHEQVRLTARQFIQREVLPHINAWEEAGSFPREIYRKAGAAGLLGIGHDPAYGGTGEDVFMKIAATEEVMRSTSGGFAASLGSLDIALPPLEKWGSQALKDRFVGPVLAGDMIAALAITEPSGGSDVASLRTRAERRHDEVNGDHYVVNGSKIYITNSPVADVLLVYAKTDKDRGAKGISAFIVEKDFPGFKVAQKLNKMGFRGSQTGELVFEDCKVPVENLVGVENAGVKVVMSGLDLERAMISPICLGIAERAFALTLDYAKQRKQFGRSISEFQMVQSKLADMYTWVESMRLFTYQTLRAANVIGEDDGGRGEIHKLTAAGVLYVAETMNKVLNDAVQVHGGTGYIWESEINRLYRSIKLLEIGAGTSEVRKMIIAKELLTA